MGFELLHTIELPWIHVLQSIRSVNMDDFFLFLNYFDRTEFSFVLIPIVWYLASPKWGIRVFWLMIANSLINGALKLVFQQPRPFHIEPELAVIQIGSLSFPSGGGQLAVLLPFILINEWKSYWSWVAGGLFFVLISLSRVYLGVHFPSDVVAGWFVGLCLGIGFYEYGEKLEKRLAAMQGDSVLMGTMAFLLAALFIMPNDPTMRTCFTGLGGAWGFFAAKKTFQVWPQAKTVPLRFAQALTITLVMYAFYWISIEWIAPQFPAHQFAFKSVSYFIIAFLTVFGFPWLYFWLSAMSQKTPHAKT